MPKAVGRDRRPLVAGLLSALVVVVFFGWLLTFGPGRLLGGNPSAMEAKAGGATPRPTLALGTVSSVAPAVSQAPVTLTGSNGTALAENEALARLVAETKDAAASVKLDGRWVAQLASKYVGIVDPQQVTSSGGHKFNATDIYAEHAALQQSRTGASVLLLDSSTFGTGHTNNGAPYWVTVATDPSFTSADKVLAWCAAQFPELTGTALNNRCLPTQLTPLGG